MSKYSEAGKGDAPRPMRVPADVFAENWAAAFNRCERCGGKVWKVPHAIGNGFHHFCIQCGMAWDTKE